MIIKNPYTKKEPEAIAKAVAEWYGSYAPSIKDRDFAAFASRSHEIARHVSEDGGRVQIIVRDEETASVDINRRTITLPSYYFSEKAMGEMVNSDDDKIVGAMTIAAINGSMTHEGLHLQYTTMMPLDAAKSVNPAVLASHGKMLSCFMINIAEDLYIEQRGYDTPYGEFLHMKNAIVIGEEKAAEAIAAAAEAMGTPKEASKIMSALVTLKNVTNRWLPEWDKSEKLKQIRDRFMEVTSRNTQQQRSAIAMQILGTLIPPAEKDGEGEGPSMKATLSPATAEEIEAAGVLELDEAEAEAVEMIAEAFKKSTIKAASIESILAIADKLKTYEIERYPEMTPPDDWKQIDQNWDQFALLLKQLKVRNRAPGIPRQRGSTIVNTRISRIATDQKIFANNDGVKVWPRVEVVLLGDASASMNHKGGYGSASIWMMAHQATRGLFKSMSKANIACAAYFHTSVADDGETPSVVHIASYGMGRNTTGVDRKFDLAQNIYLKQNYDGIVISHLAKSFTTMPARRVLIVISDGEPCGPGYMGTQANEHTKEAINSLRSKGISVLCFSLTAGVEAANSRIYGSQFNIACHEPGALASQLKRVIANLVAEGR